MLPKYGIAVVLMTATCWSQSPKFDLAKWRKDIEEQQRSIELGRTLLKDTANGDLPELTVSDRDASLGYSMYSQLGSILKDGVNPSRFEEGVKVRKDVDLRIRVSAAQDHAQDDLVEYRWTHEGRGLRAVASRNAIKLAFDLNQVRECHWTTGTACVLGARRWVEDVLKLEGAITINTRTEYRVERPWPNELVDGVSFSSAPERNIVQLRGMPFWFDRVDAFVEDGVLSLLIYKKIGQLMGYQDGSKWFPDDFRAWVHEQARLQGKLPDAKDDPK